MAFKFVISKILLVILLLYAWDIFILLQPKKVIYNHAPGPCFNVEGIHEGSEDMQHIGNGKVLITSGLLFGAMRNKPEFDRQGRLFLFDMRKPRDALTEVSIAPGFDTKNFVPHGISVYLEEMNEKMTIFIVNHPKNLDYDVVDVFEYNQQAIQVTHRKRISFESEGTLNDLVAIGRDSFYVTRMAYFKSPILVMLEMFLKIKLGAILHYENGAINQVVKGLSQANGIQMTKDGSQLLVASELSKIMVYNIISQKELELEDSITLDAAPDNMDIDDEGNIWVAVHPIRWQAFRFLELPAYYSTPSQVFRIQWNGKNVTELIDVYSDTGHRNWGSTIAIHQNKGLLIGTINSQLTYCEVKYLGI